jgi:hypothetical protein
MDFLSEVFAAMLAAMLGRLLADELKVAWLPRLTEFLTNLAVRLLPERFQERFARKWRAHIAQTPGQISKFVCSAGFLWGVSFKISIAIFAYLVAVLRESFRAAATIRATGFAITTIRVSGLFVGLGSRYSESEN